MKCPADFDFIDPEVQSNPMAFFETLRNQAPVYREPRTGSYMVTRAKDISYVAEHHELFTSNIDPTKFLSCQGAALEQKDPEVAAIIKKKARLIPHTLIFTDPPELHRYRRLTLEALSPKAVKLLSPFIEQMVDRFIAPFDSGETIDFVGTFSDRVPLSIIVQFIGAPEEDFELINEWTQQFFSTQMGQQPREEYLKTVDTMCDLFNYVERRIEAVKLKRDGTLLDSLMHAHLETGDEALTIEELISIFQVLLIGGHDTVRQTLASGMRILAADPELCAQLRQHPDHVGPFVEEVIRLHSPAAMTPRVALLDTEIDGIAIPKGATVFLCWGSANRDAELFNNPDQFQCPNESGKSHFGFGKGVHFCVGVRLARVELALAFNTILRRYSSISLEVPEQDLRYQPAINVRTLISLPIRCVIANG